MSIYHDGDSIASILTGNQPFVITQSFGENLDSVPDDWYAYAVNEGLEYGQHPGVDIGTPFGTAIYAVLDGEVTGSGLSPYFRPYPIYETSKLPDGSEVKLTYGHLSSDAVETGDKVKRGDLVGYSGAQSVSMDQPTVYNSGPHIHFEATKGGMAFDPTDSLLTTGTVTGNTGSSGSSGSGSSGGSKTSDFSLGSRLTLTGTGIVLAILGTVFLVFSPIRKEVL